LSEVPLGLQAIAVAFKITLPVLHSSPETPDEHDVQHTTFAVHVTCPPENEP
jgi:hypothetical protein